MLLALFIGAVQGLLYCGLIAFLLSGLTFYLRQRAEIQKLRQQLDDSIETQARLNMALATAQDELVLHRLAAERRAASAETPSKNEFVPGIQDAMQRAVNGETNEKHLTVGEQGTQPKKPYTHADVVVNDYAQRDTFPNVFEQPRPAVPTARELQEPGKQPGGWLAVEAEVMPPNVVSDRIDQMAKHRADRDAQILAEATQEAIDALPAEKQAELRAAGGEDALRAYVQPAVAEFLGLVNQGSTEMAQEMLAGEKRYAGEHVASKSDERLKQGLMLLTGGYTPPTEAPAEAEVAR